MKSKRNILSQGDRDGSCFLYSIANAVSLLIKKPISQPKWDVFTTTIPIRIDDFMNGNGTGRLEDNHTIFEAVAKKLTDITKMSFSVSSITNLTSVKNLQSELTENSVIITAISDGDHWVAISDSINSTVYMACSAEALRSLDNKHEYKEDITNKLRRPYNKEDDFENLNIYKNYGLKIKLLRSA
jgi:hypothetical protein